MIACRLLEERDRAALQALGRAHAAETSPHLTFDPARCDSLIDRALRNGNPGIFVAEDGDEVIGYLVAVREAYAACSGVYVEQQLLFVRPDKRGTRAAAKLFAGFIRWAELQQAEEVFASIWGRPAGARWIRGFGFEPAGLQMRRRKVATDHVE